MHKLPSIRFKYLLGNTPSKTRPRFPTPISENVFRDIAVTYSLNFRADHVLIETNPFLYAFC